ncbi:GNAT family N-acetyltransferase [Microbacterium aurantiacum]|uniref:GNAT family N-acetyltransferase n=1 Tax=Microbacterium aurantiacum TaxID=162393 RepID=UPI000C805D3E|nr:GNAT family N-acetyltransferase [Microbacterium aurantiacum]
MSELSLRRWSVDDLDLLHRANTLDMTAHLNGPETDDQVIARHERYLRLQDGGEAWMFVVVDGDRPLGSIGCWETDWRGEAVLETGWFVLPEAQGQGVASSALALLVDVMREHNSERRLLTAFPSATNGPSNGVCRKAGFTHVGTMTEVFRDAELTVNEWVLDLSTRAA